MPTENTPHREAREQAEALQRELSRIQQELQNYQENLVCSDYSDRVELWDLGCHMYTWIAKLRSRQQQLHNVLYQGELHGSDGSREGAEHES